MTKKISFSLVIALLTAAAVRADVALVEHRNLKKELRKSERAGRNGVRATGVSAVTGTGSIQLIDVSGLKYFINTNINFATTSSASGAASEADYTHAVNADTLNGGTVSATLTDAFDGYNALCLDINNVGFVQCSTSNMAVYNQTGSAPTTECSGRQLIYPVKTLGGIQVFRKVFVPTNDSFARWLNFFTNPGASPVTVRMQTSNNLGSDSGTVVVTTSDGDATPEITDLWVTTFQNFSGTTSSDPRLGHVLQGAGAPVQMSAIGFPDDNPFWRYVFTLNPGETKIIMNFVTGQPTRAAAAAKAAELAALSANSIQCMTATEKSQVVNFAIGGVVTATPTNTPPTNTPTNTPTPTQTNPPANTSTSTPTLPAANVPTLSPTPMLLLALVLAAAALILMRRGT